MHPNAANSAFLGCPHAGQAPPSRAGIFRVCPCSRTSGIGSFHLTWNFFLEEGGNLIFKKVVLEGRHWVGPRTLQPCESGISVSLQHSQKCQFFFFFIQKKTPLTQNKEALVASNNLLSLRQLQFRPNWGFLGEGNCCIAATAWSGYHLKVSGVFSEILNIFFIADEKQQQKKMDELAKLPLAGTWSQVSE